MVRSILVLHFWHTGLPVGIHPKQVMVDFLTPPSLIAPTKPALLFLSRHIAHSLLLDAASHLWVEAVAAAAAAAAAAAFWAALTFFCAPHRA